MDGKLQRMLVAVAAVTLFGCQKGSSKEESKSSGKESSGPPEFAEFNKGADLLDVPKKAGEKCPKPGIRIVGKTTAVICAEGKKAEIVECKGPKGIAPKEILPECDIRGNAEGDPCAPLFAISECEGTKKKFSCDFSFDKDTAMGKVKIETCNGPKGCYREKIDKELGEMVECDQGVP